MESDNPDKSVSDQNRQIDTKLWGWHTYLSIGIALIALTVLLAMIDLKEVWSNISDCNKAYILIASLAHYATYPVRGLRWRRCLIHLPLKAGAGMFGLVVFFYNFVDNVVPAKLGDVYGAHLARINAGITRSAALGSMVFIRTIDAWFVLLMATASSFLLFSDKLPKEILWSLLGGCVLAVVATCIIVFLLLLKKILPRQLPHKIQEIILGFHSGLWPRRRELFSISLLSLLIWTLETVWIYFLVLAFGFKLSATHALFITMISLIATTFPLTPSGTGVVELTLFSCARVIGVGITSPVAASITVVNRIIDHWLHIGLGLIVWAVRRQIGLRTWRDMPPEEKTSTDVRVIDLGQAAANTPETQYQKEVSHAN
ncbi:MAG: lysylphosphatidylglycerol synthase transmembrane domain-containing protein [Planctomycetota bacterium]|jgi:uncharacterized protein (TIRG00374 family)